MKNWQKMQNIVNIYADVSNFAYLYQKYLLSMFQYLSSEGLIVF